MDHICSIKDTIYPKTTINKKRNVVRGIIKTIDNKIILMHIKTNDIFGKRDHYELPGGGIEENEDYENALIREIKEETGHTINNIKEVGIIDIEYNPLNRIDVQHFFIADSISVGKTNFTEEEKDVFVDIVYVSIDEIVSFYNSHSTSGVGDMIHKRDLIAIKKALNI